MRVCACACWFVVCDGVRNHETVGVSLIDFLYFSLSICIGISSDCSQGTRRNTLKQMMVDLTDDNDVPDLSTPAAASAFARGGAQYAQAQARRGSFSAAATPPSHSNDGGECFEHVYGNVRGASVFVCS